MLGAGDLDSGLVRVPIAMGTTQMHLMTGDDKSFNLQKAQLGQIQADVLKGLVSACFDENGKMRTTTVRTTDALSKLWSKAEILEQEYPANLDPYHKTTSGMLSTEADLDDITTGSEETIKGLLKNNNYLFAQVVKGDSFNSVYNKINDKG